jgi:hypothetical protein
LRESNHGNYLISQMFTWALKLFKLFGETLTACLFDEIWCVSFNWLFCDVQELPFKLHEFLVAVMIREVIEVKAFDVLVQMQFFESAQIKALYSHQALW